MADERIRLRMFVPVVANMVIEIDAKHLTDGCGFDPEGMTPEELGAFYDENDHHLKPINVVETTMGASDGALRAACPTVIYREV
jgi:hypothetical protein